MLYAPPRRRSLRLPSESKMTTETLSDTGSVFRTYRAYRLDMEGRTSGPPLLFEARDDAAALLRARASMSDHSIEVWEGIRRVKALGTSTPADLFDQHAGANSEAPMPVGSQQ